MDLGAIEGFVRVQSQSAPCVRCKTVVSPLRGKLVTLSGKKPETDVTGADGLLFYCYSIIRRFSRRSATSAVYGGGLCTNSQFASEDELREWLAQRHVNMII